MAPLMGWWSPRRVASCCWMTVRSTFWQPTVGQADLGSAVVILGAAVAISVGLSAKSQHTISTTNTTH